MRLFPLLEPEALKSHVLAYLYLEIVGLENTHKFIHLH